MSSTLYTFIYIYIYTLDFVHIKHMLHFTSHFADAIMPSHVSPPGNLRNALLLYMFVVRGANPILGTR